jgi:alkanesulfonate monooxygenase SsuD/methylene tetrahydromethanopterin reductase-like flavin-dependent oxidoreductase (luciferase family)
VIQFTYSKILIRMHSLWEGSWENGAQIWDDEKGAYDPSKIHKVNFQGKHHSTNAVNQPHPSPQRTPILFQAGSSATGEVFAAKHAEAVFTGGGVPSDAVPYVTSIREAAAANGRGM